MHQLRPLILGQFAHRNAGNAAEFSQNVFSFQFELIIYYCCKRFKILLIFIYFELKIRDSLFDVTDRLGDITTSVGSLVTGLGM